MERQCVPLNWEEWITGGEEGRGEASEPLDALSLPLKSHLLQERNNKRKRLTVVMFLIPFFGSSSATERKREEEWVCLCTYVGGVSARRRETRPWQAQKEKRSVGGSAHTFRLVCLVGSS